jgi:type I restriction enzyme S subunit
MTDDGEYDLVTVKRSRGGIESRGRFRGKDISVKSQFALEDGDFLISKRQIVHGACAVVPEEFAGSIVSNEYSVLRCKPGLDLGFLKYLSHSVYFQQTCFHSSIGVHVEKMIFKLEDWLKFRVNVPPLEEQKRIAAGFEAVDAKLAALREKADGLRKFKTGLMQRLFSQELRFTREDGSDFPDWEERKLGELLEVEMGQSPSSGTYNDHGEGLPLIQGNADISNRRSAPRRYTSAPTKVCEAGDILISVRAPIGEVSRATMKACLGRGMAYVRSKESVSEFWYQFLLFMETSWYRVGQGSTFSAISGADIRNLSTKAPHPDEQARIADALSALDAKIDAVTDQITHMETFKKGLLQKMFV